MVLLSLYRGLKAAANPKRAAGAGFLAPTKSGERVFHFPTAIHRGCTVAAPCRAADRGLPSMVVLKQETDGFPFASGLLDFWTMEGEAGPGLGQGRQTRFRRGFRKNSTRITGRFSLAPFVTLQKQEYLRRQYNILCFILDTPHRGRYFHDCGHTKLRN